MAGPGDNLHRTLAKVLALWIESSDLSQKRIAEAMGKSESVLTAMKGGERLTFANLELLLRVLGRDLADLGLAVREPRPSGEESAPPDQEPPVSQQDAAEIMALVSDLRRQVRQLTRERDRLAGRVVELEVNRLPEREAAMRESVTKRSVDDDETNGGEGR